MNDTFRSVQLCSRDSSGLSSAAPAGRYRVPFDSMIVKDLND